MSMSTSRDSKLKKIAEKWEEMKKNKVQANPIDISKFIPNLDDMIKEDCVIDVLKDVSKSIKKIANSDSEDNYKDVSFYSSTPFTTTPGYYEDKRAMVLRVSDVIKDKAQWELNETDGDTYSFKLSDLDIGGSFDFNGNTYSDFKDYVEKMNLVESEDDKRDSIILRTIGIDTAEIPHFGLALITNPSVEIKEFTLKQVGEMETKQNVSFCYMPYDIKKAKKIDDWKVTERDKNTKIPFYVVKEDGQTTYFEIRKDIDAYKYISKDEAKGYTVKAIVGNEKPWGSETVIDGYKAQQRVKEILTNDEAIEDMILVLDASTTTPTKLSSNYTPYSSLWYLPKTISYIIDTWSRNAAIPIRRLTYSPFGTDKYGRFLGTLYVKLNTSEGYTWIDLSKYTLAGTDKTISNPDFNSSPELQKIKDGVDSDAFKLNSYDRKGIKYVDDLDKSGKKSYENMLKLHKEITGIDMKKKNECTMMIGDCLFLIPPQSIRNISHLDYTKVPILRGKGTMPKNRTNREQLLEIDIFFYGENGINGIKYKNTFPNGKTQNYYMNGLRALFAQFKICPFLPITNYYINTILNIEVVSMVNIVITTVQQFPKLLKATLTLREFNYRVYMPDLPSPVINETTGCLKSFEPVFAQCFEWELFRYYYQRCIIHGEKIADYKYGTYKYGEFLYSYKNVLQRADLNSQDIEFYIPDDKWLSSALKVKKDKERTGQLVSDVKTDKNSDSFLEDLAELDSLTGALDLKSLDKFLKDSYIKPVGDSQTDILNNWWSPNLTFNDKEKDKTLKSKLNKILQNYCYDLSKSEIVRYETVNEEVNSTSNLITWTYNTKLDFSNLSSKEKDDVLEELRTLDGGSNPNDYLQDNCVKIKIKAKFGNDKKYTGCTLTKAKETIAAASAHKKNNKNKTEGRDKVEEETFNYANYQDPKAMKFVPYLTNGDGESIAIHLEELAISTSNTFTEMYLKAQDGFAPQFMGGSDITAELKIMTRDEMVVACLNQLPAYVSQTIKTYRRILPCCPLKIKNSYFQMVGANEVLIDNIDINTVDGMPGLYDIRIRLTSVDRTMRQQEALRKLNEDGFTTNIARAQIKSYFDLNTCLAQAELYPDLDLPTLDELSNKGWEYLKYKNEDRAYVDPDFYIVYSFKYTALLFKQIIKEYMYKKYYDTPSKKNSSSSKKAFDIYLQDDSGMKLGGMLNNTVGLNCVNDNELSELYDETIETISTKSESDYTKDTTYENNSLEDLMKIGISLNCLTAYGIENGWQIKAGWYASIPETYINDLIEKLDEAGLKRSSSKKEDKNNKWVKQLYDIRKKAIKLIDSILSKPMKFKDSSSSEPFTVDVLKYAIDTIFDNEDGIELLKLLDPMKNCISQYESSGNIFSDVFSNFSLKDYDLVKGTGFGTDEGLVLGGDKITDVSFFYDKNANILTYMQGFLFACGCALSGSDSYSKGANTQNYFPSQFRNLKNNVPNVKIKENENVSRELSKANSMEEALDKGRFFGAYQIGIYTVNQITDIMTPKSKVDYKQKAMYENSLKKHKRFAEEGFIDPYYNFAGYRSSEGKDYIEHISRSACDNAVAFLRVVLVYLKKMIIDGYFFSEIDIISADFDYAKSFWEKDLEETTQKEWAQTGDDDHGGDAKKNLEKSRSQYLGEKFGITPEEMTNLIENEIPKTYSKIFCSRLIYPFILAMSENHESFAKLMDKRDYETLNLMTLGSNVGCADYSPLDKFLKALYALQMIGYDTVEETTSTVSNSQKIFNSIMQEVVQTYSDNPKKYVLHSFYDMIKNDKRGRLIRAFPTYYIIFVDEGRKIGTWKLYDNFYNMSSVNNIQIVKSRKNPTDVCSFTMTNIYTSYASTYDNSVYQQYVDVYGVKDFFDSIFSPRSYANKEDMILKRKKLTDTTVLQAGVRVHVRMGYSSNASKLPIVFNGKIAEVECGEVVNVVCQGDGYELCNPLNTLGEFEAKSLREAQSYITAFKDIRGTLARGGESPKNLLSKLMTAKYGGLIKNFIRETFDERFFGDNPFGIYHFGDRRFKDIFEASEIVQNIYEVTDDTLLSGYTTLIPDKTETCASPTINCSIQDKTMWEIGHMCANSGDDFYFSVRDFGMRSTVCLCKGNHYYAYEYTKEKNNFFEKRKPFQQYHYYDSYNDIVYDTIKATEKNIKTNAVGTWESTDYIWGNTQSTVGPIYLDMNIYPEYQKSMTVDTGLIASGNGGFKLNFITALSENWNYNAEDDKVNKALAKKITTNVLRQNIKDMYEGELCIIGDPTVKPYDRIDIVDTYEDLSGSVEVESVVFSMNSDTGFTTTIIPDVIAKAVDCSQEISAQTMYGDFALASGAVITARLGMKKLLDITKIDIASKLLNVEGLSALKTLLSSSETIQGLMEAATTAELGEVLGVVITPVGLMSTIVACAGIYICVRNTKAMFYSWMQDIQAISVYPIQKNQRPLIAGMAGHRGSVYGYQYNNPKDSIQDMVMGLINEGKKMPIAGLLVDVFFTGDEYDRLFNYWKESLGINKVDNDVISESEYNLVKEDLLQDIYSSASQEFSSRAAGIQSLKTKSRITSFNTKDKTNSTYLQYQIGGIYQDAEKVLKEKDKSSKKYKVYSKLAKEDLKEINVKNLGKTPKIQALMLLLEDPDIKLANSQGHNTIKSFKIAHYEKTTKFQCQLESGDKEIPYIIDNSLGYPVFDLPMIQQDALTILKMIIDQENLKDENIYFLSGTRVNDQRSWKSTGFAFALTCKNKKALVAAVKAVKKDCIWYGDDDKTKKSIFAYSEYSGGVMITVYASIKNI